VFFFRDNESLD